MNVFSHWESSYYKRLKKALAVTKDTISQQISGIIGGADSPITASHLEELENILIGADIGVQTSLAILEEIREKVRGMTAISENQVRRMIQDQILNILKTVQNVDTENIQTIRPHVVFVVGVNGVGKTTTVGKLAHLFQQEGKNVLVCAADTFRAAATEQLEIWADHTGADVVKQDGGTDPSAVLFDAMAVARARDKDVLVVDTAGRLHTNTNLLEELKKMRRVAAREINGAPHEVYLVLDATTGQNGLSQAREFFKQVGITGIVVAKLDGTAKGGIVIAIARELKIPIRYVGIGEQQEDLIPFSGEAFAKSLAF